jgi:hypothetical protein
VVTVSARGVVGAFAAARIAIGVAFLRPAGPASGPSAAPRSDLLMRRSFAVREFVLGVGGLLAVARAERRPSNVRLWAGLGALTDGGDLYAALAGPSDEGWTAHLPAVVAAAGLAGELWAFAASGAD